MRLRVEAIGINYAEVLSRRGQYGWAPRRPYVLGMEAAGVIDAVGEGVARRPGERVVAGMQTGAYATHAVVDERAALPAIEGFTVEENAAFPVNYLTAWVGLVESGRLRADDRVLISAAGGGVGTAAVQIGAAHGCHVIAAAGSDDKLARVGELGAADLVNYRAEGWQARLRDAAGPAGVDIALEMVGGDVFRAATASLAPFGRVVVVGYASLDYRWWNPASLWRAWRDRPTLSLREMLTRSIGISSSHIGYLLPHAERVRGIWDDLLAFVTRHGIRPQVGHVVPFEEAAEAHRLIESRASYGKVVLRVE
ncbi:MAG TPA: zinc-binding dehydrogenase [Longimicrobiales bacterium]|nr:zinc-binding dehydrogenase [Longimicrobiales bacterium]